MIDSFIYKRCRLLLTLFIFCFCAGSVPLVAQVVSIKSQGSIKWMPDGNNGYRLEVSGEPYSSSDYTKIEFVSTIGGAAMVNFTVTGLDPEKIDLYYYRKEYSYKIDSDGIYYTDNSIMAIPKSGSALQSLSNLRISEIKEYSITTPIPSLDNLYDLNGDGKKELIRVVQIPYSNQGKIVSFSLENNLYSPIDTLKEITGLNYYDEITIFNANNNITPDFQISRSNNVYISRPEGGYEVINDIKAPRWDINADGLPDLYSEDKNGSSLIERYIHYRQADGSYLKSRIETVNTQEWEDYLQSQRNNNFVMDRFQMFEPKVPSYSLDWCEIDYNKDGLPDLVSQNAGEVLLNIGNNKFARTLAKGKIFSKDLNGDMIPDMILYDEEAQTVTSRIYLGNGEVKEQVLLKNQKISDVWAYDFDRDGDIDVLIPINYQKNIGYSFLIFAENLGNGKFKIHENFYDKQWHFLHCGDINNDGYYDLIAVDSEYPIDVWNPSLEDYTEINIQKPRFYLFKGKSDFTFEDPEYLFTGNKNFTYTFGGSNPNPKEKRSFLQDLDNDGIYEFAVDGIIYKFKNITPNQAPAKPQAPTIAINKETGKLNVSWNIGSDAESSAADLTYSLRIGSAPGKSDIYFPFANADGSRLMFSAGNMGSDLSKILDVSGWQQGNYYISIQTVDPAFKGSAFSDEILYVHEVASPKFMLSDCRIYEVDTLTVNLTGLKLNDYAYNWSIPDGHIIEENNIGMKVIFDKAGEKTISLHLTKANGESLLPYEQTVKVLPNKIVNIEDTHKYNGKGYLDFNGNGILDMLTLNGLYSNDGKGNFAKIPKLYNSDLADIYDFGVIDYNMDGLPDIATKSNKGGIFVNENNFNFDIKQEYLSYKDYNQVKDFNWKNNLAYDFNNDGYVDSYSYDSNKGVNMILKNLGDNKNFERVNDYYNSKTFVYDVNNDGFWDIVDFNRTYPNYKNYIHINKGDFTFDTKEVPGFNYEGYDIRGFRDMNGDGYPDLILEKSMSNDDNNNCYIVYGNKEYDYKDLVEIQGFSTKISSDIIIQDMDNNGFPDLIRYNSEDQNYIIAYFYSGKEIKVENLMKQYTYGSFDQNMFQDLNGDNIPDFNCENMHYSKIKNTPPEAPANIRARYAGERLLIEWDPAYDAETPYVHMRYNVSVKKKNASVGDEGAFIISPLNGLKDQAVVVPEMPYRTATRMEIPLSRLESGTEYEIQVQSIDLWNAHSPMSAPLAFTDLGGISVSGESCSEMAVTVEYRGEESGSPLWSWDGGVIVSDISDVKKSVKWSSAGVKNITATVNGKSHSAFILINAGKDLTFTLPPIVIAEVPVSFNLPELVMLPQAKYAFRTSSKDIIIKRREGSREATAVFKHNSSNTSEWIELVVKDAVCGEQIYRQTVTVKAGIATPKISLVNIDSSTGKNKIIWDKNNINLNADVIEMVIYKEGSRYNQFSKIGSVSPEVGEFIDYSSDPQITTSRYRIAYNTIYNATSAQSEPHRGIHLMLNQGVSNSINLYWTPYEGGVIDSYRIYRGTTPESLSLLAEIAGSANSYTDMTPPKGLFYYAIEYDQVYNTEWSEETILHNATQFRNVKGETLVSGLSNAVSVINAQNIIIAQSLNIMTLESNSELSEEQPQLNLYTEILPVTANYKAASWLISSGSDLAYITPRGVLVAKRNSTGGTVTVQATTVDGSNITTTRTFTVKPFENGNGIGNETGLNESTFVYIYPNPTTDYFYIRCNEPIKHGRIISLTGSTVWISNSIGNYIDVSSLPTGTYILFLETENETFRQKVIKK